MDEADRRRRQRPMDHFVAAGFHLGLGSQGRLRQGVWLPVELQGRRYLNKCECFHSRMIEYMN